MTYARWQCPPDGWPAEAGAWPWDYRAFIAGTVAAELIAAGRYGAAAFIVQTRRFIAEVDAELHEEALRRGCAGPGGAG